MMIPPEISTFFITAYRQGSSAYKEHYYIPADASITDSNPDNPVFQKSAEVLCQISLLLQLLKNICSVFVTLSAVFGSSIRATRQTSSTSTALGKIEWITLFSL